MLHEIPEQRSSPDPRRVWLPSTDALPWLLRDAEVTGWRVMSITKQPVGVLITLNR
jgi:hypothetical protein